MECRFSSSKCMTMSQIEKTYSSQFSSVRQLVQVKSTPLFCSYRGMYAKASHSSTPNNTYVPKKSMDSVDGQKLGAGNLLYQINGTNSSLFSRNLRMLDAFDDEYGGVIVDLERLPANPNVFASMLRFSVSHWKAKGKKGVWLKLPIEKSDLVPVAVKEGFEYHHAERGYVMLTYWLPEGPSMLPANASHQVGVGGFVINDKNEVLVVQEKYCAPPFSGLWKIPTGFIVESEEIFTGSVREVKEETGIDTEFVEVVAFRHVHNVAFEKSDLFFICILKPLSTEIMVDDHEIEAAKWMPLVEFVEQPLIQQDCMFKKVIDICIACLGKRYCGLSVHQLASTFDGKISSLYYNVIDSQHNNCIGN
ncbi:Nudix hydrolase 8 [Hibiscus syriacus]|uniref:Nudix hydrolase 8 n=1 Tax=Hibiscus syriacus TaxID=106335 RepID=A0A6A3AEG1_HIBSY|nr:nudix hydrolase 8-like [Hibiscus syriacus]KAE8702438.1 Nudix hydrolase 8 [Hibiscus syriacus]